ncbi:MAG: histone deacetylase family protein, partial [Pseudorhizobium sp.]
SAGEHFRDAFKTRVLPALENFRPDFLIISAGFDAHHRDPLAQINLVGDDFDWATGRLMEIAGKYSGNRLISLLEGGYDLEGLAESAGLHICRLMRG